MTVTSNHSTRGLSRGGNDDGIGRIVAGIDLWSTFHDLDAASSSLRTQAVARSSGGDR